MKELSIEEKAKRYDEAIEKLRGLHDDYDTVSTLIDIKEELENIFSELKESEDERIRKWITENIQETLDVDGFFEGQKTMAKKVIAWLEKQGEKEKFIKKELGYIKGYRELAIKKLNEIEKQGEQKPSEWHREDEQNLNVCLGYIPDEFLRRWLTDIIHVKYDKPTDKVEPKFKVGDWVTIKQ